MEYFDNKNSKYVTPNEPTYIEEEDSSFDLLDWAKRFLYYWYLFVAALIISLAFAYVKNRSWTPQYYTEAKIIIESGTSANAYSFMQGFSGGVDYMHTNNQLLILGSYDLINRVVSDMPLDIDYYTRGRFKTNSLYGREPVKILYKYIADEAYMYEFRFIPIDESSFEIVLEDEISRDMYPNFKIKAKYGDPIENQLFFATIEKLYLPANNNEFLFRFRSVESLEDEFAGRLSLSYIGEASSVVGVSLTGNVIPRDNDFINALCNEFLEANLEEKNEEATRTIDFINDQLMFISDSLRESEIRLRQYRRENNMVDVNGYTSSILTKLSALDAQRAEISLKDTYFGELSKYLEQGVIKEKLVAPSSIGVSDPVLLDLVSKFNELQQKRSDVGEKNPNYERYSKRMADVRSTMIEVLANVRKVHDIERKAFEAEYNKVFAEIQDLPEKELAMVNYERIYKINDNYYTFLLQKQSEAQIRKASNVPDNKILQHARTNYIPVNNGDKLKVYLIFAVVALLLVAVYIILKELLNNTIRSISDVNKLTSLTVLGEIRHTGGSKRVMSTANPKSLFSEGFRVIRSRIEFITQRKSDISIMITSAESGDGKTHFATNLAGIYGVLNKKVILIDLDLRNPKLSQNLGYAKVEKGLVHVLIGEISLDEAIIKNDEELGFDVLPVGVVPPNPAELIRSEQIKSIIEKLKQEYDFVIIDSSPLGLVSDAYAIVEMVDVNLLVARSFKTNKNIFKAFIQQVMQDQLPNLYMVLNDVPIPEKGKYGYKYNKYGYHYYSQSSKYYYHEKTKYYTEDDSK